MAATQVLLSDQEQAIITAYRAFQAAKQQAEIARQQRIARTAAEATAIDSREEARRVLRNLWEQ